MLSSRRRQAGTVLTGLLLYQSLFMAVGACAQAHEAGHAGGYDDAPTAGHVESHRSERGQASQEHGHAGPITLSPGASHTDGSDGCCAHHATAVLAGTADGSGAVADAPHEAPTSGSQDCTALSSCGTAAVDGANGADGRIGDGDTRSAVRPASLVPAVFDLSITPPPPKA